MVSKKKDNIFYYGTPSTIPQPVTSQIPNFENSGVKYQGYYKRDAGGGLFDLRTQSTRFIVITLSNGDFGSVLFNRPNPEKKFFCTKAFIQHHGLSTHSLSLGQMHVADVTAAGGASTRFYFFPVTADDQLELDFSDCPRLFQGNRIDFYTQASLGATEFIVITLFGWEED